MSGKFLKVFQLLWCIALTAFSGNSQHIKNAALDAQFSAYEVVQVNSTQLLEQIVAQRNGDEYRIQFMGWNLRLQESGIIPAHYIATAFDGKREKVLEPLQIKALNGYTEQGGRVSITLNNDFVQGFIRTGMFTYYFEPMYHFDPTADRSLVVVYNTKDIKPGKEKTCGATSAHTVQHTDQRIKNTGERMPGQCFTVEYAIATDFSMFSFYGSTTAVQNHNIAVTNDMQTNYDDEFADAVQFEIVQQFIVTTSGGDPAAWTATTNPNTLLTNFSNWGPSGFTAVHDVGSLWTRRDFDGTTVGIAWLSSVCTSIRYNALQDFTSNANNKRVLLAHELGHNFSADHDAPGSNTIMAPSVNNSTTWSAASVTAIQNHYLSRSCLSTCLIGPPQISFTTATSSILENGGTGSTGTCNEAFKTLNIPVTKDRSSSNTITVSVSIAAATTATSNRDFTLLTNTLTFAAGPAATQNIQLRIIDDAIFESTENIVLNLTITGGTANLGANPTHTIQILDQDEVSLNCCSPGDYITYGNNNGSTNLIFWGEWDDARTRVLYLPSQLTSANITAGFITSLRFYVQSKGSTQPYQNFRVGMANVSQTTLLNMPWVNSETVFTGNISTVQGVWNEIVFDNPFYWNGTSSLYFEFCFNNNSYTLNDIIRFSNPVGGGTGRYIEALIQDGSNGCVLTPNDALTVNYSNFSIQPHFQFRQLTASRIETAVTATSNKSSLKSGETANFYSSNGRVYASVRNIGATDINCIEAAIETAGSSTPALPFGGGNYSAKTIKIDASYNAVYEVTLYYTQAELSAFGTNANRLNIIKTQSTLATATLANSVIYRPDSIISGFGPDNAYGYRGTFSGFSRFAVTNRNIEVGSSISSGDLVINESGRGFILKNKSGQNFLTTVTNAGALSTQSATALNGTALNKSDLNINTTARNLILRSPNGTYRRLNVSDTGVLSITDTTLPALSARLNSGNLVLQENGGAILMKSPNGNCWRIFVNETGQLRSVLTLCP